jgi:type IV pilus biogenesis protein CpaD/CtpE
MGQAVRGVLIAAATVLIAGCGSDSDSTTPASSSTTTSTTPTHTQAVICKAFGGVSPNQRRVTIILADGTRCRDGIITNGTVTISRPAGGWKTLYP